MSYYYSYYLGYKLNDKIYPLGPYNSFGDLCYILCRSRSFASNLHNIFRTMQENEISDELRKEFSYKGYDDEDHMCDVRYIPVDELPNKSCVTSGYCLIDEVKASLNEDSYFEGFTEVLDPIVYSALADNERSFGKPQKTTDDEGYEYTPKSASDYMYFSFVDHCSKEYEAFIIRMFIESLSESLHFPNDAELVVLEMEG